jgi:homoserine kinase
MIKIRVPATSANFCIGFDVCGLALNIYNIFGFEKSDKDILEGFDLEYNNSNNLVLTSYKEFFKKFNIKYIPIKITLIEQNIPNKRGLGSSASCIVAGVLAANIISNANISKDLLLSLMTSIEGHPDNVSPAFLGNFVASFKDNDIVKYVKYDVDERLLFNVFISNQELSTTKARDVLPKVYKISDVVANLGHIIHLPKALENGDFNLLKDILIDKIHEPYRLKIIDGATDLINELKSLNSIGIISGSGSTILSISLSDFDISNTKFKKINVLVDKNGACLC